LEGDLHSLQRPEGKPSWKKPRPALPKRKTQTQQQVRISLFKSGLGEGPGKRVTVAFEEGAKFGPPDKKRSEIADAKGGGRNPHLTGTPAGGKKRMTSEKRRAKTGKFIYNYRNRAKRPEQEF